MCPLNLLCWPRQNNSAKQSAAQGRTLPTKPNHVALIKLRAPQILRDSIIEGLVRTISQLIRLGLSCIIVVDAQTERVTPGLPSYALSIKRVVTQQTERVVSALEKTQSIKARRLDDLLGHVAAHIEHSSTVKVRGTVEVQHPQLLWRSLNTGIVPVLSPLAFTCDTQRAVNVNPDDVMLAIVRELSGVRQPPTAAPENGPSSSLAQPPSGIDVASVLDRIIILDPVGAMPSSKRTDHTHIFLNLEQEYEGAREDVLHNMASRTHVQQHLDNLDLLRNTLALLPPSSSALLTTPWEAATPTLDETPSDTLGVQTRRPKNPLIFNLLTDKPLVSSSLPTARMSRGVPAECNHSPPTSLNATFAKRGMPLTMIPDPRKEPWQRPIPGAYHMNLDDPRLDFPRLLNLIEDSFSRPLDVHHYLDRIRNRIAGVIVAGEYEGGAVLTWELPPGVPNDGSEGSRARMVPYLDKFAVLKRSQGAGGVADIVFSAMVRSCFPNGVCWRSRRDNPVNKWYFERSAGTLKIPESSWTMFWTDKDLQHDSQQWRDYEAVCRTVVPSWADNQHKLD